MHRKYNHKSFIYRYYLSVISENFAMQHMTSNRAAFIAFVKYSELTLADTIETAMTTSLRFSITFNHPQETQRSALACKTRLARTFGKTSFAMNKNAKESSSHPTPATRCDRVSHAEFNKTRRSEKAALPQIAHVALSSMQIARG